MKARLRQLSKGKGFYHGELCIIPMQKSPEFDSIPSEAKEAIATGAEIIVGHSESGHHHMTKSADVTMFDMPDDEFTSFLRVARPTTMYQNRNKNPHDTVEVGKGDYVVKRQKEYNFLKEEYQRAQD